MPLPLALEPRMPAVPRPRPVPRVVLRLVCGLALRETDRLVTDALLLVLAACDALAAARCDCAL